MLSLETIHLPHTPPDLPVHIALFTNVANAKSLREELLQGNEEFEYAFVDASMILSRRHVFAAVFRAMNDYLNDRLKSRNVHAEIVFSLSSNNNIGEAFRRFGISDTTSNLLVLKIPTKPGITVETVADHLEKNIQGKPVSFDDNVLAELTDLTRLKKAYKLGSDGGGGGGGGKGGKKRQVNGGVKEDVDVDVRKEMEVQILGLMALRGAT